MEGRLFQYVGPAAEKARSSNRIFIRLTQRSCISVNWSCNPEAELCM